jgi:hypothetical protein
VTTQPTAADWELLRLVPRGRLWELILVAMLKRALQCSGMRAAERIELLEALGNLADRDDRGGGYGFITPQAIAAIEPADSAFVAVVDAARRTDDPHDPGGQASFRLLTSPEVLRVLVSLNPSLIAAVKLCLPAAVVRDHQAEAAIE